MIREITDYDIEEEIVGPITTLKMEEEKALLVTIKNFLKIS